MKLPNTLISIKHYASLSEDQLKQFLIDNGPLAVGIYASDRSFSFYKSGVYSGCTSSSVNHAVLLVGFTENGDWIIKNSWGLGWGDGGFGIISRNNNCGILNYVEVIKV